MKKALATMFALSCLCLTAFAVEGEQASTLDLVDPITASTAYMDLEEATPAMQEKILEARNDIIFHNSWVVDGHNAYCERADGTIEVLPKFSELFPGWDVPVDTSGVSTTIPELLPIPELPSISLLSDWSWTYGFTPYLEAASRTGTAPAFTTVTAKGQQIETVVRTLSSARNRNLGYANPEGDSLLLDTARKGQYVNVRASTYSTPSYATINIGLSYNDLGVAR